MSNSDLPAMPVPGLHSDCDFNGLSKREYFAALAMQGLCSSPNMRDVETEAQLAVSMADALLAALEKTNDQ